MARLLGAWLVTRVAMAILFLTRVSYIDGDVRYYWNQIRGAGLDGGLVEYPYWAALLLGVPATLVTDVRVYLVIFVGAIAVLDLATTWSLARSGEGGERQAWYWVVFLFALGPVVYFRFDMLVAVVAGFAVLLSMRRPAWAGALVAFGAALKLWPITLIGAITNFRRNGVRSLGGFLLAGVLLVAGVLVLGGPERLTSPLDWQRERGLQMESVWASPFILARTQGDSDISIIFDHGAWEVAGPGVDAAVAAAQTAQGVAVLVMILIAAGVFFRRAEFDVRSAALVATCFIALLIAPNSVLSPQYLAWLAIPLAIRYAAGDRLLPLLGVLACLLTQYVFPLTYPQLFGQGDGPVLTATVLVLRNALVVVIAAVATVQAVRLVLTSPRSA